MKKKLSEMSLEELWELFPIFLVESKYDEWKKNYEEIEEEIKLLLKDFNTKINHVGSTAIKDIWAKPIIDVLVEFKDGSIMANLGPKSTRRKTNPRRFLKLPFKVFLNLINKDAKRIKIIAP